MKKRSTFGGSLLALLLLLLALLLFLLLRGITLAAQLPAVLRLASRQANG